jgi:hypothetical protein
MSEQPAPYRPHPVLKPIERGFESLLFNSRWLMAPFYFGLVVSLAVLLLKFCMILWEFILHAPGSKESDIILGVLSLIDVSLTGNLILIVVFSGYENFVSKIDPGGHPDWPEWMTRIQFGGPETEAARVDRRDLGDPSAEGVHEHRYRVRAEPARLAGRRASAVRGVGFHARDLRPLEQPGSRRRVTSVRRERTEMLLVRYPLISPALLNCLVSLSSTNSEPSATPK